MQNWQNLFLLLLHCSIEIALTFRVKGLLIARSVTLCVVCHRTVFVLLSTDRPYDLPKHTRQQTASHSLLPLHCIHRRTACHPSAAAHVAGLIKVLTDRKQKISNFQGISVRRSRSKRAKIDRSFGTGQYFAKTTYRLNVGGFGTSPLLDSEFRSRLRANRGHMKALCEIAMTLRLRGF